MARIAPEDIETFSVMKDASATAMYGARGANGVILVTTKKGQEGSVYATARYETVFSMPTKRIDVVDPVDYMKMYNRALLTGIRWQRRNIVWNVSTGPARESIRLGFIRRMTGIRFYSKTIM